MKIQYAQQTIFTARHIEGKARSPADLKGKDADQHYMNRNSPRKLQRVNRDRKAAGLKPITPRGARY